MCDHVIALLQPLAGLAWQRGRIEELMRWIGYPAFDTGLPLTNLGRQLLVSLLI